MKSFCELVEDIESKAVPSYANSDETTEIPPQARKFQKLSETEYLVLPSNPIEFETCVQEQKKKKSLKRWSAEEDKILLEYFYRFGNDWDEISANMPGRAVSAVKNRFYWISKRSLPTQIVQKIKSAYMVKKLYKSPKSSNELFRKINNYIKEECIFESFLALDKPAPYTDLVYKLKMTPQDLEKHAKMQMLMEKAQQLYISCENAKQNLAILQRGGVS